MMSLKKSKCAINSVFVVVSLLLAPVSRSIAQGGQGSLGTLSASHVEGEPVSYQHILTPGDRGEWPLTASDGDCILVRVSSSTFDPAAQLVDSLGSILIENDDVAPGVQDAQFLFRFTKSGDYKILVKGFKSTSGGRYELVLRRFRSTEMHRLERNAAFPGRTGVRWHRFAAAANETLVVTTRSAVFNPDAAIFAPNGERSTRSPRFLAGGHTSISVFRATTAGDYYLRVGARGNSGGYVVTVAPATSRSIAIGTTGPQRHLAAGGLDIWTFDGAPGDLVRIKSSSSGPAVDLNLSYVPKEPSAETQNGDSPNEPLVPLPNDPKARGEQEALLRQKGKYQIEVIEPFGNPLEYTIEVRNDARVLSEAPSTSGKIGLGGSDYWSFEGKAGQILRIAGNSSTFDAMLELFTERGERIEWNDDGGTDRNALLTALIKERGKYLIRVSAVGNGGSGPYELRRLNDPTRPIQLGGRVEQSIGSGSSDIWSFSGKAGQTILLSVRSQDFEAHLTVFGPDAIEVAADGGNNESADRLLAVHLPLSGKYTIWVSAKEPGGKYPLHLIDGD